MSFLTKCTARSVLPLGRGMAARAPRAFGTSLARAKTPTESVKDGLKSVDRAVTDNVLLPGLDAAESAGSKVKEGAEAITKGSKGKAEEMKGKLEEMKGKAEEVKGKAKGKAAELEGQAKGAASETKGKAKDMAADVEKSL